MNHICRRAGASPRCGTCFLCQIVCAAGGREGGWPWVWAAAREAGAWRARGNQAGRKSPWSIVYFLVVCEHVLYSSDIGSTWRAGAPAHSGGISEPVVGLGQRPCGGRGALLSARESWAGKKRKVGSVVAESGTQLAKERGRDREGQRG